MSEIKGRNGSPTPVILLAVITLWQFTASAVAAPGDTTRVSVDSSEMEGNSESGWPSISADGLFVSFYSPASNLVIGDTNGTLDTFLYDRQTSTIERISVASGGGQGNDVSGISSISADGRFVAFFSYASNLVAGDTNNDPDIFVRDRQFGTTERVSVNSSGAEGNDLSVDTSISADGRYVAFYSEASNLVAGDTNGTADVFVRDRQTSTTERISVASGGGQGNVHSVRPSITPDGRFVAFDANAYNLVAGDTNDANDVFVHDRQTGTTELLSVDSNGAQGNGVELPAPDQRLDQRGWALCCLLLVCLKSRGGGTPTVHLTSSSATGRPIRPNSNQRRFERYARKRAERRSFPQPGRPFRHLPCPAPQKPRAGRHQLR